MKYLLLTFSIFTLASCNWEEHKIQPNYVKESFIVKFYNNGDFTLQRMSIAVSLYLPENGGSYSGAYDFKELNNQLSNSPWYLHPFDSLTVYLLGGIGSGIYIGCPRLVEFAVYDKDSTSANGCSLKGKYIIDGVIEQKYAVGERKYPDNEIIINWPEDSLLFMDKKMMEQVTLFPNPCYGFLSITYPKNITSAKLEVYLKSGKLALWDDLFVDTTDLYANRGGIDVSVLSPGNYIFKIITPVDTYSQDVTIRDRWSE